MSVQSVVAEAILCQCRNPASPASAWRCAASALQAIQGQHGFSGRDRGNCWLVLDSLDRCRKSRGRKPPSANQKPLIGKAQSNSLAEYEPDPSRRGDERAERNRCVPVLASDRENAMPPTIAPISDDSRMIGRSAVAPIHAPSAPSSLKSPYPMPSLPVSSLNSQNTDHRLAQPTAAPSIASDGSTKIGTSDSSKPSHSRGRVS